MKNKAGIWQISDDLLGPNVAVHARTHCRAVCDGCSRRTAVLRHVLLFHLALFSSFLEHYVGSAAAIGAVQP